MRVTDAHVHVIVPEITRGSPGGGSELWRPLVRRDAGRMVVEMDGREIRSMTREVVDVEAIVALVEPEGVERVVVSPWVALLYGDAEPAACLERCRIQNEALASIAAARPDRVAALGAVPLQDPELAAEELVAVRRRGLAGVEVAASVEGVYLGDARFEPFWAAAEATEALVFMHPTTRGFSAAAFGRHYLWNTVGNPLETTIAAAQMVMEGVLERHPRLRVLLAHGGGALPILRGRLRHAHAFQPDARADLSESPDDSLKRFYFDTLTHDPTLLRALIEWAGADRVLLGSDYPFDMGDPDPVATVRSLELAAHDEAAILSGNAERLLRPKAFDA